MCGPAASPPSMPTIVAPPQMPTPTLTKRKVETPVLSTNVRGEDMTPSEKLKGIKSGFSQFRVKSPLKIK